MEEEKQPLKDEKKLPKEDGAAVEGDSEAKESTAQQRKDGGSGAGGGGGGGGWGGWGFSPLSVFSDLQKAAEEISRSVSLFLGLSVHNANPNFCPFGLFFSFLFHFGEESVGISGVL